MVCIAKKETTLVEWLSGFSWHCTFKAGNMGRSAIRHDSTDTHCHCNFPSFSGHEVESLALAELVSVRKIIVLAGDH
jgi:hypothetical protein